MTLATVGWSGVRTYLALYRCWCGVTHSFDTRHEQWCKSSLAESRNRPRSGRPSRASSYFYCVATAEVGDSLVCHRNDVRVRRVERLLKRLVSNSRVVQRRQNGHFFHHCVGGCDGVAIVVDPQHVHRKVRWVRAVTSQDFVQHVFRLGPRSFVEKWTVCSGVTHRPK